MRPLVITVLFALLLAGCATTGHYGNFVPATANQEQIANDATQQLVTMFPPAKTCFELHQTTTDPFGEALVNSLRERGFALKEFSHNGKAQTAPFPVGKDSAVPLRYVLDQAETTNLYRLTLLVGDQSIARPYIVENGSFVPAGYWARKE